MSSRFLLKITLTSALILVNFVIPSLLMQRRQVKSITDYYSGKCKNRKGQLYPTTKCHQYVKCSSGGNSLLMDCESPTPFFNITSKQCEPNKTSPCNDAKKINVMVWQNLDANSTKTLSDGKVVPIPATKIDLKTDFGSLDDLSNMNFNVLLKTSYLAVEEGVHTFSSHCIPWCKMWIRRDICGPPELVLHQKKVERYSDKVSYYVQKNYTMTFGTFYYLTIVHIGRASGDFKFQIGVKWPYEDAKEMIPSALLRLPPEKKCPKQPSIHLSPTATTTNKTVPLATTTLPLTGISSSTGSSTLIGSSILTGTSPLTGTLSRTRSLVPSRIPILTETSTLGGILSPTGTPTTTIRPTFTHQYTTPRFSTAPPELTNSSTVTNMTFKDNSEQASLISSPNKQANSSASQIKKNNDGLPIARKMDLFIENLVGNQSGLFIDENIVFEVSFPDSNYSFPPQNISNRLEKKLQLVQIFIPATVLVTDDGKSKRKVVSVLYLDLHKKMQQNFSVIETETNQIPGTYQLISPVIASAVIPKISGLKSHDIVIRLAHFNTNFNPETKLMCAFLKWKNDLNSDGFWSTEGCIRDPDLSNQNLSVCRCNHLTHFGILMQVGGDKLSSDHVKALKMISYIGCALSLIGACLTMLAIMCLPGARSDRNFIHVNLAVSIALAQVTFLAGIDETGYEVICTVVAALLHYFLLVAFSWMLIEGLFLHILIVKVFHDHLPKKRFYVAFCWGLPLLIVLLSVNLLRDGYGTKTSCWLSTDKATIWTFSGPAILVIIINIIILCKVMKEINSLRTGDRRDSNVRSVRYGVRSTIILLPLLGLTWAFGLIIVNDSLVVFQYLFTIFNSLQGLFIFLFHCVFNTEVRKAFWRKVDIWFTNHNHPYGNNAHSRSKSHNDASSISSPEKDKKTLPRNGLSMYSFDELTKRESRKFSTATASTCIESWPHKLSLTPSMDGPYPARFTSSLSSDDIKYQPICKQDAGHKRISLKGPVIKVEDLNGNTQSLNCDSGLQKDGGNSVQAGSNLAKNGRSAVLKEKEPNTNSQQQHIAPNSTKCIETPISEEESPIHNPRKPERTKKSSHEPLGDERNVVGIGGQRINSGDSTRHVGMIDVDNSTGSFRTKL